ncbi:SseB protein N-terminal domain-containing protein [Butyrivibrio sp. ob235]|uniref:SseB family protein n=1 Tax=Butyrivibrio sp. ob235 TaxID=1761780 RepID=UPI0008B42F7B|nr:SseB family protein [Butyrivibrio sp. ob235]SEK66439.1 SseB protein N-terminal domain-containing protein [Butyrivibrio sp. ob235]
MGIFNFLGGKKNKEEEEALLEQQEAERKEQAISELKEKHKELGWPTPGKLNPVKTEGMEEVSFEDPLTDERKDEIGELVYEEDLNPETIKFFSLQELLFLLTVQEKFNKVAPLPGYEANHRKVYNEILGRVRDARTLYVLFDKTTGYPFIDHGYINIYSSEEYAEEAVKVFAKQFRQLAVRPCKADNEAESASERRTFFDYLYYLGIENFIVDNGYYRAHFKRNEIVAAPDDWGGNGDKSPKNPALVFAILDFLGEARWPVKYEKREEVLKAKEMRMATAAQAAKYIVPMQHEGPVEVLDDGRFKFTADTKIRFPEIKSTDEKHFLPVFTDGIEFSKMFRNTEYRGAVFGFADILKFVGDKAGVIINPAGEKIMIPRERMLALHLVGQAAEAKKGGSKPAKKKLSETEAAIQSAMSGKGIASKNTDEEQD